MKATITIISAVMFFITPASSQPTEEWVARYDNGGADQLYDVTVDGSGNVYVTGASIQGSPTTDYLTIKYNSSGLKLWEKVYEGISGSEDRAYAIAVDDSGNVYVTGSTGYDNSIVTIKYNSLGDSVWARSYIGPTSGHNWTYPTSIFVDDSGFVYVAGTSEGLTGVHGLFQDYTTIKYSTAGVQLWVARHNGAGTDDDVVTSMTVDASGNVYVTGYAGGGSAGSSDSYRDIVTIKYNSLGDTLWKQTYKGAGTSYDEGIMITLDDFGNVYVTGVTVTDTSTNEDIITIKYSREGTELWRRSFNGPGSDTDEGAALAIDANYNVYVTGKSDYGSPNGFDMITIKYDSLGTPLWAKNFNGTANGNDVSEEIILDDDGNIYVFGTTVNTTTSEDYQLIKYDTSGTQQWETRYTNSSGAGSQEYAAALVVDETYNIYAAGMSALDYAVAKYSQVTGVEEAKGQFPVAIFPNPSSGKFTVKMEMTEDGVAEVYNLLGEKVYAKAGCNKQTLTEIDLSGFSKGIYLARIFNGQKILSEKIIIQ